MDKKALVRVKVYKTFDYPKSMLSKKYPTEDAIDKSRTDMQIFVDEMLNNNHERLNHSHFLYEATEELGYSFRNRDILTNKDNKVVCLNKAARVLATHIIENKYGPLNRDENPNIYEVVPEVRDNRGNLLREETIYMKAQIEQELYNEYNRFTSVLDRIK